METIFLREIDAQTIGDHSYLERGDKCLYLEEYTARKKYDFSTGNNLISNLKKKRGKGGQHYKLQAIRNCSRYLSLALNPDWVKQAVIVPVPPSKIKGHLEYDDRMLQVARGISSTANVREIVIQTRTMPTFHETDDRPGISELISAYEIDESAALPVPRQIGILDDVLTCGTHFKAMQRILKMRYPEAIIIGLFIARRVLPPEETASEDFSF